MYDDLYLVDSVRFLRSYFPHGKLYLSLTDLLQVQAAKQIGLEMDLAKR